VDVREVWEGAESPAWVMGFVGRVFADPGSFTLARVRSGDDTPSVSGSKCDHEAWTEWVGYSPEASRLDDVVDILGNQGAKRQKQVARRPKAKQGGTHNPATLDEAYRLLGGLSGGF
jgi:hypothetical protein